MHTHDDPLLGPSPARAPARVEAPPDVARSATQAPDAGPTATPQAMLELQRTAGNASVAGLVARRAQREDDGTASASPVLDIVGKGGGQPMAPTLRREMEGRLGADFGDVRLHTDSRASQSAEVVNAHAYTVGRDVVFRSDRWNPDSSDGKKTLAHELTHVIQQRDGPVDGTPTGGGIRLSDPSDPFERAAESNAATAMTASPAPAAAQGDFVQREGPEDEEEEQAAQGDFVQREGAAPKVPGEEDEDEDQAAAQGDFVQREGPGPDEDEEEQAAAQGDFVQREGPGPDEDEEDAAAQGAFVGRELAPPDEDDEEKQRQGAGPG